MYGSIFHAEEWKTILPFVDILIPFVFARDPEHLNVVQMKQICDECGTHMWWTGDVPGAL